MVQDYQENYGRGWISLYRSIKDHWVWSDPVKLKWWLLVLFEVNHSDNKVAIGYKVAECKRGQSLKSLRTWASEFGCGTKAATRFFDMLEADGMITRKTIGKGKHSNTLLTVCNYDSYQSKKESEETLDTTKGKHKGDTKETQGKRKRHTNNNDNNSTIEIIEYLNSRVGSNYRPTTQKTKDVIKARLNEGFTVEDFKTVIEVKAKEWENDPKFCKFLRPETLFSNKFEGYLNQQEAKQSRDEELNVHLLKHLRDVQSDNDSNEFTDDNRVRRIS